MSDLFLSASKIKQAQSCSWKYHCSYQLKLPQKSNDGASRGSVCHLVFELLGKDRHKHHYDNIISSGTIQSSKAVSKLVYSYASKLNVSDEENLELIDMMIVQGLLYDFFGNDDLKASEQISEKEFNLKIDQDGKRYNIRGFIDKLFLYSREKKALIRDFKTSKQVFKGKEISDNLQNLMYCLAVKKLYPEYNDINVEFLFLKFDLSKDLLGKPGKGVLRMEKISEDELEGFEYQLTSIQDYLDNFNEDDATSNFAADQDYPSDKTFGGPLMCGKQGFKKSKGEYVLDKNGEKIKNYICEFRNGYDYYAILDKDKKLVKCVFTKEECSNLENNFSYEKRSYKGCPYFNKDDLDFLV
jgi:hypothetical protein